MSKLLVISSYIFLTNSIASLYCEYYIYSFLFACLTRTSILFHSNPTIYTNLLDKIFIIGIVGYGGNVLYKKINDENKIYVGCSISTFLLSIFLFYYGYCTNNYCFNPNKCIGDKYHCALHVISSLGHHMIIFL